MKLAPVLATIAIVVGTPTLALAGESGRTNSPEWLLAQGREAESVCIDRAEDRGLRVRDVLDVNEFSGGAEVIMAVERRRESFVVGCDYSTTSRDVELYRLNDVSVDSGRDDDDDDRFDRGNSNNDAWRDLSDDAEVRDADDAESIARQVVGEQLGIDDPYSDVVRIDDISQTRSDDTWVVEGRANGAPFVLRIRSSDAAVVDMEVY